jgi:predicted O-methyltransferase YrrM
MLKPLVDYYNSFLEIKDTYTPNDLCSQFGTPIHLAIQKAPEFKILLDMLFDLQPKTILEIGQEYGGSTYYFSKLFSNAKVIGLDIDHSIFPLEYYSFNNLELVTLDSGKYSTYLKIKDLAPEIDFLFIDGCHYYPTIIKDFVYYSKLVSPGGIICFHDIHWSFSEEKYGVGQLWNLIKKRYSNTNLLELVYDKEPAKNFLTMFGLGILVKE